MNISASAYRAIIEALLQPQFASELHAALLATFKSASSRALSFWQELCSNTSSIMEFIVVTACVLHTDLNPVDASALAYALAPLARLLCNTVMGDAGGMASVLVHGVNTPTLFRIFVCMDIVLRDADPSWATIWGEIPELGEMAAAAVEAVVERCVGGAEPMGPTLVILDLVASWWASFPRQLEAVKVSKPALLQRFQRVVGQHDSIGRRLCV